MDISIYEYRIIVLLTFVQEHESQNGYSGGAEPLLNPALQPAVKQKYMYIVICKLKDRHP